LFLGENIRKKEEMMGGPVMTSVEGAVFSPHIEGNLVREKIKKTDDFTQAGERYRSMSKTEMKHLVENLVADLSHVTDPDIQRRAIENLKKADERQGRGVAVGLGLEIA
jgi:catalase